MANNELRYKILVEMFGENAAKKLSDSFKNLGDSSTSLKTKLSNLSSSFNIGVGSLKLLGAAAAAAAGYFTVQQFKGVIDLGDDLQALSDRTGIAGNKLYSFKEVAKDANVDFGTLSGALRKFSVNLADSTAGNEKAVAAFKAIGVSTTDSKGKLKDTDVVLGEVSDKFLRMEDGAKKALIANELFGKSGPELISFLNQGSEALGQFAGAMSADFTARSDQFNDTLGAIGRNFQQVFIQAVDENFPTLQQLADYFKSLYLEGDLVSSTMTVLGEVFRDLTGLLGSFFAVLRNGVDTVMTAFIALLDLVGTGLNQIKTVVGGLSEYVLNASSLNFSGASKAFDEMSKQIEKTDKDMMNRLGTRYDDYSKRIESRNKELQSSFKLLKDSYLVNAINPFDKRSIGELEADRAKATAPKKKSGGTDIDLSGLNTGGNKKQEQERKEIEKFVLAQKQANEAQLEELGNYARSRDEIQRMTELRKFDNEVQRLAATLSKEGASALMSQTEEIRKQKEAILDRKEAQKQDWTVGATQSLMNYLDSAKDVAGQTRQAFDRAFSNMENGLVEFVKTGKLDFRKFADDLITDIIRIQVRMLLAQAVTGAKGLFGGFAGGSAAATATLSPFANGGIMTASGSAPLRKYAGGGVANSPQLALYGEGSRPEAFVPLPDGRSIPVSMKGGGGGTVNVTVINNMDGGSETKSDDKKGREIGNSISQAVQSEIIKQKRPGGLLWGGA